MRGASKKKRIRVRNFLFTWNNPAIPAQKLLDKARKEDKLRYIVFQHEVGEKRGTNHFQGYLEYQSPQSFKGINWRLFGGTAHLESRRGSQAEAIAYCTDKTKKLVTIENFQWGLPKKAYSTVNRNNFDIPINREEQWIHLKENIANRTYQSMADVEVDYPYLVIHHGKRIHELFAQHQPVDVLNLTPAKVIGLYGKSGAGKSCLSGQLLKELGYQGHQVTFLKSDLEAKLWFELLDEQKKVLVVEEVRHEWPKHNSLINGIDRKTPLPVKGSLIRNNFELIIISSLGKPEELYVDLDRRTETLRRIYDGQVIEVVRNDSVCRKLQRQMSKGQLPAAKFPSVYGPKTRDVTYDIPLSLRQQGYLPATIYRPLVDLRKLTESIKLAGRNML